MYVGSLPAASVHATWSENLEVWSVDDDTLADLSDVTEIELRLRDPASKITDLLLTLTGGEIIVPSQGVIQWRAEVSQMQTLPVQRYEVLMTMSNDTDTIPLIQGSISIVG